MTLYSRRQLVLLLLVLAVAGFGLGVGRWRRAHPELVARLEQIEAASERESADDQAADAAGTDGARSASRPGSRPAGSADRPLRHLEGRGRGARRPAPDPGRRLASKLGIGPAPIEPLDLNRATAIELTRLPGVGPVLGGRMVAARAAAGGFASVDDLRQVRGLGRLKLEQLRPLVTVAGAMVAPADRDPMVR